LNETNPLAMVPRSAYRATADPAIIAVIAPARIAAPRRG
jgi:hypothetical protein